MEPWQLLDLGTATLGESGAHVMAPWVHAVWPGARLAAPAYPVSCFGGDNLAVHVAVTTAPAGSALVVDVAGEPERGYWGEVLTTAAQARQLAGLVIDGGVRDLSRLEALGFPVFASMVALRGASKVAPGAVGVPVTVGRAPVRQGDWVVGDADGVVVVPGDSFDDVVARAQARAAKETALFEQLRAGATTLDLLDLDAGKIRRDDSTS